MRLSASPFISIYPIRRVLITCLILAMGLVGQPARGEDSWASISEDPDHKPLTLKIFADVVDAGWEQASISQRDRIVRYAWEHFLSKPAAYIHSNRTILGDLIVRFGPLLTRHQARQVQQQLSEAYATEQVLGLLTYEDLNQLRSALIAVRASQPQLAELTAQWLLVHRDWAQLDWNTKFHLLDQLRSGRSPQVQEAAGRVVFQVVSTYRRWISDDKLQLALMLQLAKDTLATDELYRLRSWLLTRAFEDGQALSELSLHAVQQLTESVALLDGEYFLRLRQSLQSLDKRSAASLQAALGQLQEVRSGERTGLFSRWIVVNNQWEHYDAAQKTTLLRLVQSDPSPVSKDAATQIAKHVWESAKQRPIDSFDMLLLLREVAANLSSDQRQPMAHYIAEELANGRGVFASVSFQQLLAARHLLESLGITSLEVRQYVGHWADRSVAWQSYSPAELASLLRTFSGDRVDLQLSSVVWRGFVAPLHTGDLEFTVFADGIVSLKVAGKQLIHRTESARRADYVQGRIELEAGKWYPLEIKYLNHHGLGVMQLLWAGQQINRQIIPAERLSLVAGRDRVTGQVGLEGSYYYLTDFSERGLVRVDPTIDFNWRGGAIAPQWVKVTQHLWEKHLRDSGYVASLDAQQATDLLLGVHVHLTAVQSRQLLEALQASPQFVKTLSPQLMKSMWRLFPAMTDEEAAALLLAWARQDDRMLPRIQGDYDQYHRREYMDYYEVWWNRPMPGQIAFLQKHLTDGQNKLVPGVARMLTLAHQHHGQLSQWRSFLNDRLATPALTGNARVPWLLIRAYAEENDHHPAAPLVGVDWINEALAVAEDGVTRLEVVQWLVARYAAVGRFQEATTLLLSVAQQFDSAPTKQQFEDIRQALQSAQSVAQQQLVIHEQRTRIRSIQTDLTYYTRQLDEARARRAPNSQIQSLERLIETTRKQLAEASQSP